MCGRCIQLTPDQMIEHLKRLYPGVPLDQLLMEPRYNIPPSAPLTVVGETRKGRFAESMKWGLMPSWAKDPSIGSKLANARIETAAEKPSFQSAMQSRRCLIFVTGFYEWKAGTPKQPFFIYRADGKPMAFAGLWESWRQPDGSPLRTCTILTRAANGQMATIHDRMPVIVEEENYERWIDAKVTTAPKLPVTAEGMLAMHAVSRAVNSAKNDGPECIEPIAV